LGGIYKGKRVVRKYFMVVPFKLTVKDEQLPKWPRGKQRQNMCGSAVWGKQRQVGTTLAYSTVIAKNSFEL
jgi:hypothetical protein